MNCAVVSAPANCKGFDCNSALTSFDAACFAKAGYRFAVRYAPRVTAHAHDLTAAETIRIMTAGLGLMVVQHVESDAAWTPTSVKGHEYGVVAGSHAHACGVLPGTSVWLDLEGVAPGTPPSDVMAYCNNWYTEVLRAGFTPGLYVGWHCGLSAIDLYRRLRFQAYWVAYNKNVDEYPAVRGPQMKQGTAHPPAGVAFPIDRNVTMIDAKGGTPMLMVPDTWQSV